MRILAIVLGVGLVPGLATAGGQPTLADSELDPVLRPDRVETFALEDVMHKPAAAAPSASPVITDLPGSFVVLPGSLPVAPDLAAELSRLLLAPASYSPKQSACLFSPGVAIRFHQGSRALDVFVCFHCRELAFQRVGSATAHQKLSFDPADEKLFALIKRMRPADARLDAVRKEWDEEVERGRQLQAAEERWRQAMPAALRPFWETPSSSPFGPEVGPMQAALARAIPDSKARIRSLLQWYGSGAGRWSGFPAYEDAAGKLLLLHSTPDLLAAVDAGALSTEQTEGAARLFASWDFGRKRPQDRALLSPELRARLLEHSLASADMDKRARAQAAFQDR